jgi:hypothetical protein
MSPKYWAHTRGITGAQKLDGPIHPVRIGAGQGFERAIGSCSSQGLGAGNADPEGEVGVKVEMDHGIPFRLLFGILSPIYP